MEKNNTLLVALQDICLYLNQHYWNHKKNEYVQEKWSFDMRDRVNHFYTLIQKIHTANIGDIKKHTEAGISQFGAWRVGIKLNPFRSEEYATKLKELRTEGILSNNNLEELRDQIADTQLELYIEKHIATKNYPVLGVSAQGEAQTELPWLRDEYYRRYAYRGNQSQSKQTVTQCPQIMINTNIQNKMDLPNHSSSTGTNRSLTFYSPPNKQGNLLESQQNSDGDSDDENEIVPIDDIPYREPGCTIL